MKAHLSCRSRLIVFVSMVVLCLAVEKVNSATTAVTYQVSAGTDDGYAWRTTEQDIGSGYLMIGDDRTYSTPFYMSAMRFTNIGIPRSAAIINARLKISSTNEEYRGQIYGLIQAEAVDNADDFTARYIGEISKTTAATDWDHKDNWATNTYYTSPDISGVIQEVVSRNGWNSGNAMAICYSTRADSGKSRMFGSFEAGAGFAATLEITYQTYKISGHIKTSDNTPIEAVTVSAGDDIESTTTDADGYYELFVPPGWSGSVSAKKIKWETNPQSYSYNQITADIDGQDYIADYIGIIIVQADGTGDCPTIQAAIDAAVDGDIVILQPGTYTGDGNRDNDFKGKAITVQGATGDPNDCIIECQGTRQEPHRGFKFISGEDANSILEGITITNGYGLGEDIYGTGSLYSCGGAVFCESSSPIINNCVFSNNLTRNYGGGIYNLNSNPTTNNCIIIENRVSTSGGGIYNYESSPTIENCIISDNIVQNYNGGGIINYYSNPVINNCVISDNLAHYNGGGIYNYSSDLTISNCNINNNSTIYDASGFNGGRGGGIYNESSSLIISDCTINNNVASGCNTMNYGGGGIYNAGGSSIIKNSVISNNLISSSSCAIKGGGIYNDSDMLIENSTIIGNLMSSPANTYGGGIYDAYTQKLHITNSIIWANQSSQIYGLSAAVRYSNIEGGYAGIENINRDPLFADDYHISLDSPCINAGDPNYSPDSNETDIDGNPRIVGIRIDMGADEFATQNPFIVLSETDYSFNALEARENPAPGIVKLNNFGLSDLNWTANSNVSWLVITPSSGSLNCEQTETLSITANINGLSAGTYFGQISIEDPQADNSPKIIDVHLTITGPSLEISQNNYSFIASKETIDPEPQVLTISNLTGGGTLSWNISSDCNWMIIEPNAGTITTGSSDIILDIDQNSIDYGTSTCQLTVNAPNALNSPQFVTVNLTVLRPELSISQNVFNFTAQGMTSNIASQTLTIQNTGYDKLNWHIEMPNDCNWLIITPLSGQTESLQSNEVTISIDCNNIVYGEQSCQFQVVDSNAENSPQVLTVNLEVLPPELSISDSTFNFIAAGIDSDTATQILTIQNTGFDSLNWHIEKPNDCNWLKASPLAGQAGHMKTDEVILSIDHNNVEYGTYSCQFQIVDPNAANSPHVVTVNLEVLGPEVTVSPARFSFETALVEPNTAGQILSIQNTGYDTLYWDVNIPIGCGWLRASETSGQATSEVDDVILSIDHNNIERGFYQCEILISAPDAENSPQVIPVDLRVLGIKGRLYVPTDYPTIQAAVDAAVDGDEVIIEPGTYSGTGNYNIYFKGKTITVRSVAPNNPAIVAATRIEPKTYATGFLFYYYYGGRADSVIDGLTIRLCIGRAAIECRENSSPTIRNCIIEDNYHYDSPYRGGNAIECYGSSAIISNCVIRNNQGSGLWCLNSDPTVRNCIFSGNRGSYSSYSDLIDTSLGGGILFHVGNISVINCTFSGNTADVGGGICSHGWHGYGNNMNNMIISNCIFRENDANDGPQIALINYQDNPPTVSVSYSAVQGGEEDVYVDPCCTLDWENGNLDIDPCFAVPGYWILAPSPPLPPPPPPPPPYPPPVPSDDIWVDGDYHLKSQKGRWKPSIYIGLDPTRDNFINLLDFAAFANSWQKKGGSIPADLNRTGTVELSDLTLLLDNYLSSYTPGQWVLDNVTSPCIDFGDPNSNWTAELWPHGKRINIGAYGGTPEAGMSLSNAGNIVDLNGDGCVDYTDVMLLTDKWLYEAILLAEDLDRNGFVNFTDVAIFANNWQGIPNQASCPNPADGAIGVDPNTDLSWTADHSVTSHDVYFGTRNPPPFVCNQTSTTFEAGKMAYSTKYYWRIDEVNSGGVTTGTVWSFRTYGPPPP